jgi:hypothetical protein
MDPIYVDTANGPLAVAPNALAPETLQMIQGGAPEDDQSVLQKIMSDPTIPTYQKKQALARAGVTNVDDRNIEAVANQMAANRPPEQPMIQPPVNEAPVNPSIPNNAPQVQQPPENTALRDLNEAEIFKVKGAKEAYQAGQKKAAADLGEYQKGVEVLNQYQKDQQAAYKAQNDYLNQKRQERDKLQSEVDKQPLEKGWGRFSTGNKIVAAISLAMGAFGSALTKGPNVALEILNKTIDDDYEAQRDLLSKRQKAVESKDLMLTQARQIFSDENSQRLLMKDLGLSKVELGLKQSAAAAQSQETKAKYMDLLGSIGEQRVKTQSELLKTQSEIAKTNYETQGAGNKLLVKGVGMALDENAAKEAREVTSSTQELTGLLGQMKKFRQETGRAVTPADRERAESLAAQFMMAYKKAKAATGNVASEKSEALYEKIAANPGSILKFGLEKEYDELQNNIVTSAKQKLNQYIQGQPDYSTLGTVTEAPKPRTKQEVMSIYQAAQKELAKNPGNESAKRARDNAKKMLGLE